MTGIVRVEVLPADIAAGERYAVGERHPIVMAVRRALGLPAGTDGTLAGNRIWVGLGRDWLDIAGDLPRTYDLPMCAEWIADFDDGREVFPFCFWFNRTGRRM